MESVDIAMAIADAVERQANDTKFQPDADTVDVHRPYPKQQSWFDIELKNVGTREVFRVTVRRTSVTNNLLPNI